MRVLAYFALLTECFTVTNQDNTIPEGGLSDRHCMLIHWCSEQCYRGCVTCRRKYHGTTTETYTVHCAGFSAYASHCRWRSEETRQWLYVFVELTINTCNHDVVMRHNCLTSKQPANKHYLHRKTTMKANKYYVILILLWIPSLTYLYTATNDQTTIINSC